MWKLGGADFVNTPIACHLSTPFASTYKEIEFAAHTKLLYEIDKMAAGTKDKTDTHKIALKGEPAASSIP